MFIYSYKTKFVLNREINKTLHTCEVYIVNSRKVFCSLNPWLRGTFKVIFPQSAVETTWVFKYSSHVQYARLDWQLTQHYPQIISHSWPTKEKCVLI